MFQPVQLYGDPLFRTQADEIDESARAIHSLRQRWQAPSRTQFAIGDAPEDWPNMRIVSREPSEEIAGAAYDIRLTCEGILDSRTWIELDRTDSDPSEGWDNLSLRIFTRDATAARWARGAQLQSDAITGVIGTASTDKLTSTAHGLTTGQLCYLTFASGFGGLTSGTGYYVIVIDADNIKLATTYANALVPTAINISSDGTDATITPVVVGFENLFITDRSRQHHRAKDYSILDLQFKGLLSAKPAVRRMNAAASSFASKFDGSTIFAADIYAGYPPVDSGDNATLSGDDLLIEYNSPEPTIIDSMVVTTAPDPNWINLFWTPENAPTITFWSFASSPTTTYNVPWGWSLANMQYEQIPGKNVWLLTLTWIYRRAARASS
jgi:hypothetical protein